MYATVADVVMVWAISSISIGVMCVLHLLEQTRKISIFFLIYAHFWRIMSWDQCRSKIMTWYKKLNNVNNINGDAYEDDVYK